MIKNQGTPRNYVSIPTGSTVAVQGEDGGLWTHGTVEGKGDHNHGKHIKPTQSTGEQYLQDQLQKTYYTYTRRHIKAI